MKNDKNFFYRWWLSERSRKLRIYSYSLRIYSYLLRIFIKRTYKIYISRIQFFRCKYKYNWQVYIYTYIKWWTYELYTHKQFNSVRISFFYFTNIQYKYRDPEIWHTCQLTIVKITREETWKRTKGTGRCIHLAVQYWCRERRQDPWSYRL